MKKIIATFLTVLITISSFATIGVFAEKPITVTLNGSLIEFDVQPCNINGRVLVPVRAIFEALGATVDWNNATRTATAKKGDVNVSIAIDDTILYKNNNPITLDVPAQLNNGRTLVPLRAVSEAFECDVQWDGNTSSVIITSATEKKSNGNLANDGHFAFSNGWIYYCKDSKIHKMKTDGSNKQVIFDGWATSLNIVNGWLYFVSGDKINKIKTDGTQRTILDWVDVAQDCMVISDNVMYYADTWGGLFRVNLDGTNTTRIGNVNTLFFQVEGDWIYYNPEISPSGLASGNIYRIKTDGTQKSKIIDCSAYDFNVVDGWIYYDHSEYQNSGLFKARLDGSNKTKLTGESNIKTINVRGEWIYYYKYYDVFDRTSQGELRKIDINGKNDTFIKKYDSGVSYIGISDNIIACDGFTQAGFGDVDIILMDDDNVNVDTSKKSETFMRLKNHILRNGERGEDYYIITYKLIDGVSIRLKYFTEADRILIQSDSITQSYTVQVHSFLIDEIGEKYKTSYVMISPDAYTIECYGEENPLRMTQNSEANVTTLKVLNDDNEDIFSTIPADYQKKYEEIAVKGMTIGNQMTLAGLKIYIQKSDIGLSLSDLGFKKY